MDFEVDRGNFHETQIVGHVVSMSLRP